MKIHEFQAKDILARYGVPVPRGEVADTAERRPRDRRTDRARGSSSRPRSMPAAGEKAAASRSRRIRGEAEEMAGRMLGMTLVTHQTGPEGKVVHRLLVEEALDIRRELYVGIVIDRAREAAVVMASTEGGVEIEKVAAEKPRAHLQGIHRSGRRTRRIPGQKAGLQARARRRNP